MAYRLEVSPSVDRDLERLKGRIHRPDFERLRDAIHSLADDPRPHGVRKLKGAPNAYRVRVGSYRVVYQVHDTEKLVLLLQIVRRTESTYRA